MKSISLAALVALAALTTGCMSKNISQYPSPINAVVDTDLKAQITVGNQITGTSQMNILFNLIAIGDTQFADGVVYGAGAQAAIGLPDPISKTKAAAAYKAVTSSGADVIIAPRYVVDVTDYFVFKQVTVTVTGYAGKINSIR